MSHLLRRPGAVPALFSSGIEADAAPRRPERLVRGLGGASSLAILPFFVLSAELPLIRSAAGLLRFALPH